MGLIIMHKAKNLLSGPEYLTLVLYKLGEGGGGVSRDYDSNPGISVNLSRDWTSLGWQVWGKEQHVIR